ncbi:hypothetical protein AB0F46_21660 [Streptomyces sp. NPDC026665]|uniref:hypothetical protein n=1 Tax=Streptomyces sp. NPDC026665 TaxID=3154798 RepID=UPI0033D1E067
MPADQLILWAVHHPKPAATAAAILLTALTASCWLVVRRASSTVLAAGIGALVCTSFSGDTSWRFAGHTLHMQNSERLGLFAAGEVTLIVCAIMARANKKATAIGASAGTPGVPGVLVWCITGVQIIPAYSEAGLWGGTVRVVFGPVMAAMLWHLAMGLEIRVTRPEALSTGLPAQIGAELRERLLATLGLATRGRTAVDISRDRATARAVRLAARRHRGWWARAALKKSVARSGAAVDGSRRHALLQQVAARRTAGELATVPVVSPWVPQPVPDPHPRTPLGVTGAELRAMETIDAVLQVRDSHPDLTHAELASLCTEYGVPVSPTQVLIAVRTRIPAAVPVVPDNTEPEQPGPAATPTDEPELVAVPVSDLPHVPALDAIGDGYSVTGLHLDVTTEPEVRREFACAVPAAQVRTRRTRSEVHARVPDVPVPVENGFTFIQRRALEERALREAVPEEPRTRTWPSPVPAVSERSVPGVPAAEERSVPVPRSAGTGGADDVPALLVRARSVDDAHRQEHDRPASIHTLKRELGVGQPKAQAIRAALDGRPS